MALPSQAKILKAASNYADGFYLIEKAERFFLNHKLRCLKIEYAISKADAVYQKVTCIFN